MAFNQANGAAVLKTTFTDKAVQSLVAESTNFALWQILQKKQKGLSSARNKWGKAFVIPQLLFENRTRSTSLATAETKSATSGEGGERTYGKFEIEPIVMYSAATVSGVAAETADGRDEAAFIDAMKTELEGAMRGMADGFARDVYGAGYGELGQIKAGSTVTSTTIVVPTGDLHKYQKGDDLVAGSTLADGLRSATSRRITGVAGDGTLTLSGSPAALSWAAGDYLFNANVTTLSTSSARAKTSFSGLAAYNPVTAPTSGYTVHGLDLSTDWRLGGVRVNAADHTTTLDAVSQLVLDLKNQGSKTSHLLCNPVDWQKVMVQLPDQNIFKSEQGKGNIGYESVRVMIPGGGTCELVSDTQADIGQIRAINDKHLYWVYNRELIHIIDNDGLTFRKVSGDNFTVGIRSIMGLACDKSNTLGVLYGIT
jgi:hypothetical protein